MEFYKETQRLILRSPTDKDAFDFAQKRNSPFVFKYNLYRPCDEKQISLEFENYRHFLLLLKNSSQLIGSIRIQEDCFRYGVNSVELQFWLTEEFSNKGYMTEALSAITEYLFNELKTERLSVRIFAENTACLKLAEKLKFKKEGYLNCAVKNYGGQVFDLVLYSLSLNEFLSERQPK